MARLAAVKVLFLSSVALAPLSFVPPAFAQKRPAVTVPVHYSLTIVPDFEKNTFRGDEFVDFHLTGRTTSVTLNAAELTFEDATVSNGFVTKEARISIDKENELATFSLASGFESGDLTLHLHYLGIIHDSCCGFYRVTTGGNRFGVILSPARSVFPSADDRTAKATFDITTTVDYSDQAISNGRLVSDTPDASRSQHTLKFATTPKMSPYLVTLAIGQFECEAGEADGIPIQVCGAPDKKGLGSSALEAAVFTLHFYDQYFEMKYPYGKLDFVGLPGIPGAMENTACILALDSILFGRRETATEEWLRNMALGPVAHEMAHQWLGDLVTPRNDKDGWLSEGLATWMQYKPVAAWRPGWKVALEQLRRTYAAMDIDSLAGTSPIRNPGALDQIKYDKSAAVVRMVEAYVGADTFEKGMNLYVARYAYKNVSGEDLWREIAKASGKPVERIAEGFVTQPGFPLVTLTSKCVGRNTEIVLKQNRFFPHLSGSQSNEKTLWQIPVCLELNGKSQCVLFISPRQEFDLEGCGAVFGNSGAYGYYRTSYDFHNLNELLLHADSSLAPEDRLALLNDIWAEILARQVSVGEFLRLSATVATDDESAVLQMLSTNLGYLRNYFVADSDQMEFERWIGKTFALRARQAIQTFDGTSLTTAQDELLRISGNVGRDPEIAAFSRHVVSNALSGVTVQSDLFSVALEIAALNGDERLYDKVEARMISCKDPSERILYLQTLASFEEPRQIERTVAKLTSGSLNVGEARALRDFLFRNRVARPIAWQFLKDHWPDFQAHGLITAGMFDDLSKFCEEDRRNEIQGFFTEHPLPELLPPLERTLNAIKACEEMRPFQQSEVRQWLKKQAASARAREPNQSP